jgi:hypothetical protein
MVFRIDIVSEEESTGSEVLLDGGTTMIHIHQYFEGGEGVGEDFVVNIRGEEAILLNPYSNKTVRYFIVSMQNSSTS